MMNCYDSRQVSRRIRQVLLEFRDAGGVDGGRAGAVDANGGPRDDGEPLEQRVAVLEADNRELRATVEAQVRQLEEMERRVSRLEERDRPSGEVGAAGVEPVRQQDWRPPQRRPGMPGPGVVALEGQPDEAHTFGPAAPLLAEWRRLQVGREQAASRVDRAKAAVRRWELEAGMLGEFHLTLPLEP